MQTLLTDFEIDYYQHLDIYDAQLKLNKFIENRKQPPENFLIKGYKIPLFGEFNESTSFDISLKYVSHSIYNIHFCSNKIFGEVCILNTEFGKQVQKLIEHGIKPRFKLRAVYSFNTTENNIQTMKIEKIFTWDIIT